MVEKPPNALAVTTPFAERMEGCPPSPFPVDGFPPPATVLMVKLCPTQTPRNKKRPQAVFVIGIRHVTICGKMAEHHYRGECFSTRTSQQHPHIGKNSSLRLQPHDHMHHAPQARKHRTLYVANVRCKTGLMKYGNARVSTDDQNADMQHAALKKAGCKSCLPMTAFPPRLLPTAVLD